MGKIFLYHVAAYFVSFNLICNLTIFRKSLLLASAPPTKSTPGDRTQAFKIKSHLICFISIAPALVIEKFKYLTSDPVSGVKEVR